MLNYKNVYLEYIFELCNLKFINVLSIVHE